MTKSITPHFLEFLRLTTCSTGTIHIPFKDSLTSHKTFVSNQSIVIRMHWFDWYRSLREWMKLVNNGFKHMDCAPLSDSFTIHEAKNAQRSAPSTHQSMGYRNTLRQFTSKWYIVILPVYCNSVLQCSKPLLVLSQLKSLSFVTILTWFGLAVQWFYRIFAGSGVRHNTLIIRNSEGKE